MNKIIYLPLDERPCNYIYPQFISRAADIQLVCPPKQLLGSFKAPARVDELWQWLFENAENASHIILSSDLMLYGGIVPSRLHHLSLEECKLRLEKIKQLKKSFINTKLYVFGLITRCPAYNSSDEEPDYYAQHGISLNRFGIINHLLETSAQDNTLLAERSQLEKSIPAEILSDFSKRREINFASHLCLIDYFSQNIIDHLIIPLDDCKEHGWASSERQRLAAYAAQKNVLSRIGMYPGADEAGCTLTAKAVCGIYKAVPQIWLEYSSISGKSTIPPYEDRPIGETAPYHVLNAGGQLALNAENADCAVFINPPTAFSSGLENGLDRRKIYMESQRNLPLFISRITQLLKIKKPCFIADCAVPNGADQCLMQFLKEQELLFKISGYSGWNTSSNAMGTVVALAAAYAAAKSNNAANESALQEFLLLRYVEDWGYMTHIRRELTDNLSRLGDNLSYFTLGDKGVPVAEKASEMLTEFMHKNIGVTNKKAVACMPWNRMFEIELNIE